ncbi:C-C motif chemokine 25b [Genypterus blacodes]|uniref:C-C motif chemokine 25b n=1 Tax=Genypterus blacodes TaxID=154954 RepID=UPI003F76E9F5
MKFQVVFFLLLFTCMYLSLAQGSYGNCCIGHVRTKNPNMQKKNVESYRMQETDGDCNIRAVVFQMKKRPGKPKARTVCANPYHEWVLELMQVVDQRNGQN